MTNFAAMLQPHVKELGQSEERLCPDPTCGGLSEPEQDGDHRYWECLECGYAFGYEKVEQSVLAEDADGNCSVGIPADVRRAASAMGTPDSHEGHVHAEPARSAPVSLGLSIGVRKSD